MKLVRIFCCGLLLSTVAGCATFYPPASTHELKAGAAYITNTDASRRLSILVPRADGKGYNTCSEPSPDVALQLTQQVLAQAQVNTSSGVTVDPTVQLQFSQSVVQLASRSESLQFLREALYRLCEQSINQNLTSDQTMQLYTLAMQTALNLAEADLVKNQATLSQSQADLAKTLQDPQVRALWERTIGLAPAIPTKSSPSSRK